MSEELNGIVSRASSAFSVDEVNTQITKLRGNLDILKATFTFPLSDCRKFWTTTNTITLY